MSIGLNPSILDSVTACPAVCTQQVYISVTAIGMFFLLTAIILLFFRRAMSKKVWIPIFLILLLLGLGTLFSIHGTGCGSGCDENGTYFEGLRLFPNWMTSPGNN